MLENLSKKYKEIDASKKKQMLNRNAVKYRKRKTSKLQVDVCISQFCQKIKEGPYYVCTVSDLKISYISLNRRWGNRCEKKLWQSRVPQGPGKFHLVVLV